ncbi:MAG: hypothetical protein N2559_10190, partial [Anaerolineae bacterium]|nr:hypothetical protein [Anaerolineae bacterium]
PPSGSQFYEGDTIVVQSTSADPQGVVRVQLLVDDKVVREDRSPTPQGQMNFTLVQTWQATLGTHTLAVRAYNIAGLVSDPISVSVTVLPRTAVAPTLTPTIWLPSPTPSPSATPSPTPTPIAPTATPQVTLTITPTASPSPQAPAAPSDWMAIGTGTTIRFEWTDNSTDERGFRIYQAGVAAPVLHIEAQAGTGKRSYEWTGRPCNLQAGFYIRAHNAAGESAPSPTVSVVTIPCAPTNLNATTVQTTTLTLTFTDNATNESGFHVYRSGESKPLATLPAYDGTGARTVTVGSLPCGTAAAYSVRAYNTAGESSPSNAVNATTNACTVTVTFTRVLIHNDTDSDAPGCVMNCGPGEVWLEFTVNGQNKRWPPTGQVSINTGETKPISDIVYTFLLMRTQNLTITVKGREEDTLAPDDPLGTATATFAGTDNWKAGEHCTESASPNYFRICYTISVTP